MTDRELSSRGLDIPLRLRTPDGAPLPATAREVAYLTTGGAISEARLELELEPDLYEAVDRGGLFHLDADARGPGADRFAPSGPVRVTARLADDLLDELVAAAGDPAQAGHLLGEQSTGELDSALLATESWYALSVTAPVELPPELAADGTLAQGYATTWTSGERRLALPMLVVAEEVLRERGWSYTELDDDTALGWRMHSVHGTWTSFAVAREAEHRFAVYSVLDATVPLERVAEAAALVARVNWGLPIGNWELDMDDGTLRYKTSVDVSGDRLSLPLAARTIERNLEVTETYIAGLTAFAEGRVTAAEALSLSEQ